MSKECSEYIRERHTTSFMEEQKVDYKIASKHFLITFKTNGYVIYKYQKISLAVVPNNPNDPKSYIDFPNLQSKNNVSNSCRLLKSLYSTYRYNLLDLERSIESDN